MKTLTLPGVRVVPVSQNRKIGLASSTWVAQPSCPSTCSLRGSGCYAEGGPSGIHTSRLNREAESASLSANDLAANEAACIDALAVGLDMRLHVVGDCRTTKAASLVGEAVSRYKRRYRHKGLRVWTYTHSEYVQREAWGDDVSVLRSCDKPSDIAKALAAGYAPAIVTAAPTPKEVTTFEAEGVTFIVCPYHTKQRDCVSCGLCLDGDKLFAKGVGIAFWPHGSRQQEVSRRIGLPVVEASSRVSTRCLSVD
jgi:hypothetical protein